MKKNKLTAHILSGALVALGFTACEDGNTPDQTICEYGTPHVRFQVKGTVTDPKGNPLENIRVIVREAYNNLPNPYADDTTYTDSQGKFESNVINSSGIREQITYFDDIDGEANGGSFKSDSIRISDMDGKQTEEGGSWYQGRFEFTVQTQLEKEDKQNTQQ